MKVAIACRLYNAQQEASQILMMGSLPIQNVLLSNGSTNRDSSH